AGAEHAVGAGADHDAVAATGVDIDAGGAGGLAAGFRAQIDAVGFRQFAGECATGVVAECADEGGGRAGAGASHGLVETLAAGTGHVLAGDGGASGGEFIATPD